MNILDRRTLSVLTTVLVFVGVAAFLYGARKILVVFLFAIFFAYLLFPLVSIVQEKSRLSRGSRNRAILQVYFVLVFGFVAFISILGPHIVEEGRRLGAALPGLIDKLTSGQIAWTIGGKRGWSYNTQLQVQQFLASHRANMITWAQMLAGKATEVLSNVIWLVLIPILAIFFLRDGEEMANELVRMADMGRQRILLRGIFADMNAMLAGYIRAQLLLAALSLVAYTVVMLVMRVPYAFILGIIAGVAEFIPVVGPLVAAVSIFGVAFLSTYPHMPALLAFLGVWRLVQDYYNSPRIMGDKLELHPLAALFAILVGGELAGVLGVFLSIPAMATLRLVWRRWKVYAETQQEVSVLSVRDENEKLAKADSHRS